MRNKIIVCVSFFLLLFVGVGTSNATPIIQDFFSTSNSIKFFENIGQSFTAEDKFVDLIGIGVQDQNAKLNDLTINDFTIEMAIFKGEGAFSESDERKRIEFTLRSEFAGYVDMDVNDLVFDIGESYTIALFNDTIRWAMQRGAKPGEDLYPGGQAYLNDGPDTTADARFRVLPPEAKPIPEPSTMILLCTGLFGLAGWGRKKFKNK